MGLSTGDGAKNQNMFSSSETSASGPEVHSWAGSAQVCGRTQPLPLLRDMGSPRSVGWFKGAHVKPGPFGS